MASPFEIQIVTPEKIVFSGEASSAVVPAADGYLGILPHHAPLLAALGKGRLEVVTVSEGTRTWNLSGGLLEIHSNHVSVLADEVMD